LRELLVLKSNDRAEIVAIGLAMFFPAISGADPWTGSTSENSAPTFAEGATPDRS
jgi:hypothetical protein